MKALLHFALLFLLIFCMWGTVRIVKGTTFNQECGGYLSRAANANTVDLAKTELKRATDYLERHNLTEGYTSVLWRTPDEDIGFWYTNLKASLDELEATAPDATPLERSNVLMKLRETLMTSSSEGGSSVTMPEGISVYPSNTLFFCWAWISIGAAAAFIVTALWNER